MHIDPFPYSPIYISVLYVFTLQARAKVTKGSEKPETVNRDPAIYIYSYMYIFIYIYIERERKRERELDR